MDQITKQSIPRLVNSALIKAGLDPKSFDDLPLQVLWSNAFKLDSDVMHAASSPEYNKLIIVGKESHQGTRTSGRHVNLFSLAGVISTAMASQTSVASTVGLFVALLGSCTVSLTPEQSAFFLASKQLESAGHILTMSATAAAMAKYLNRPHFTVLNAGTVIQQLVDMGVSVSVGALPNQVVSYKECSIFVPSM